MANFIGLVYATLKNEGIDTKGMSTDEAVKKYNELQEKSGGKSGEKEGTPAENKKLAEKVADKGEEIKKGEYDEKVVAYTDGDKSYGIYKAPNGKYYNSYGSSKAGMFDTEAEAREMMKKHRPKAEEIKSGYNGISNADEWKGKTIEYKRNYDTSIENNMEIDWDLAEKNEKENGKFAKNPNRHDKYGNELLSDEAFKVGVEAGKSYLDYQNKYGNDLQTLKKSNVFLRGIEKVIGNAITNNGFDPKQDMTYTDYNQIIGSLIGEEVDMEKYESRQSNGFTGRKYIDYQPK